MSPITPIEQPIKLDAPKFKLATERIGKCQRVADSFLDPSQRDSRIAEIREFHKHLDPEDEITIFTKDYTPTKSTVKYIGPGNEPPITEEVVMFTRTTDAGNIEFLTDSGGQPVNLNASLYDALQSLEVRNKMDAIPVFDGRGILVKMVRIVEDGNSQQQIPAGEKPKGKYLHQEGQEPKDRAELYSEAVKLIADAKLDFSLTEYVGNEIFRAKTFQSCVLRMYELAGVNSEGLELVKIQVGMAMDAYRKPRNVNPDQADENCVRLLYPVLCNIREMQNDPAFANRFREWFQAKQNSLSARLKICYEGVVGDDNAVSTQIMKGEPVKYGNSFYIEELQTYNRPERKSVQLPVGRINLLSFPQDIRKEIDKKPVITKQVDSPEEQLRNEAEKLAAQTRAEGFGYLHGNTLPQTDWETFAGFIIGIPDVGITPNGQKDYSNSGNIKLEKMAPRQVLSRSEWDPYTQTSREVFTVRNYIPAHEANLNGRPLKDLLTYGGKRGEEGWVQYDYHMPIVTGPNRLHTRPGAFLNLTVSVPPHISTEMDRLFAQNPRFADEYFKALYPTRYSEYRTSDLKRETATEVFVRDMRINPNPKAEILIPYSQPLLNG